jgi:hypothetical protein
MFAAAFPLAPLIILVNCFVERLLDGSKLFSVFRRVTPEGAEDIGEALGSVVCLLLVCMCIVRDL